MVCYRNRRSVPAEPAENLCNLRVLNVRTHGRFLRIRSEPKRNTYVSCRNRRSVPQEPIENPSNLHVHNVGTDGRFRRNRPICRHLPHGFRILGSTPCAYYNINNRKGVPPAVRLPGHFSRILQGALVVQRLHSSCAFLVVVGRS